MWHFSRLLACGIAVVIALASCGPAAPSSRQPLRIAAASDLQAALPVIVGEFKKQVDVEVEAIFGSSGQLAQQIRQGAPYDVFLSADRALVDDLAKRGIVRADSVRPYAIGSLVLAVQKDLPESIVEIRDLARPEIKKIAIANPELAPYGAAAKQAVERAGMWAELEPKLVQSATVRQALQFLESGNADAGFIGSAIAEGSGLRIVPVDPALHDPIVQWMGIPKASAHADGAAAGFGRFLTRGPGQAILGKFGFKPPPND